MKTGNFNTTAVYGIDTNSSISNYKDIREWYNYYSLLQDYIYTELCDLLIKFYNKTGKLPTYTSKGISIATLAKEASAIVKISKVIDHIPNYIYRGVAQQLDYAIKQKKQKKNLFKIIDNKKILCLPKRSSTTIWICYGQMSDTTWTNYPWEVRLSKTESIPVYWSGKIYPRQINNKSTKPSVIHICKKISGKGKTIYTVNIPYSLPDEYGVCVWKSIGNQIQVPVLDTLRYPKTPEAIAVIQGNLKNTVGIDPGQSPLLTFSDGTKVENFEDIISNPTAKKRYISYRKEIEELDRKVSKIKETEKPVFSILNKAMKWISKKYTDLIFRRKILWIRINNLKKEFSIKYSKELLNKYQNIAIEKYEAATHRLKRTFTKEDDTKGKYSYMGKKIQRNSPTLIINQLLRTFSRYNRYCLLIDPRRYGPTQTCSHCGYRLKGDNKLKVSDKEWTCRECNTTHDRDINAAINIKNIALNYYRNNWRLLSKVRQAVLPVT